MTAEPRDDGELLRRTDAMRANADRVRAYPSYSVRQLADDARWLMGEYAERLGQLAAADRENAELRGEVERLRVLAAEWESQDSERLADVIFARQQLAAAQAQLAEAREHAACAEAALEVVGEYREAAEARLEAVRVVLRNADGDGRPGMVILAAQVAAALSAAPQPEPEPMSGCACGHTCDHGPHDRELDHAPEWTQAKADLERSLAETFAEHARARGQVPPASDEPTGRSD